MQSRISHWYPKWDFQELLYVTSPLLDLELTRRKLLGYSAKIGAGSVLATTLTSLPFSRKALADTGAAKAAESKATFKHSACLVNCGSRCALKVKVEDDRIIMVEPEPALNEEIFGQHQVRPCLRGRSNRFRVYNPDRLKYPLKRIGKRGEGKFKRISWEEATKLVADEIKRVSDTYGNESIFMHYGSGAYYHTQGQSVWQRMLTSLVAT